MLNSRSNADLFSSGGNIYAAFHCPGDRRAVSYANSGGSDRSDFVVARFATSTSCNGYQPAASPPRLAAGPCPLFLHS
jgi:hypothetical protein